MSRARILGLVLVFILVPLSCHQALLTAPPGSTMELYANPMEVPAFGGVSIITAVVTESIGTPVADGTVVQFFTDLGQVEERGKTTDGVARVKFVSDSRSGTAHIIGFSGGGAAPAASATSSASATGTATVTPTARPTVSLMGIAFADTSAGATGSVDVKVGAILVKTILVSANPQRIVFEPRQSQIVATALDGDGNPIANIPLFFTLKEEGNASGLPRYEWMESGSSPVYTDNNGRAYNTLYTRAGVTLPPRKIDVTVVGTAGDVAGTTSVQVN
jgi:hypothetical protein